MNQEGLSIKPEHVPDHLVVDFDLYNIPGANEDLHRALHAVQTSCPDIFWTPRNSGHWVVTRADDIEEILRNPTVFSSRRIILPRDDNAPRTLPIEADDPEHADLRLPLNRALANIVPLEKGVREITVSLLDEIAPRGECEFVEDFARIMPMCVFLDMVGLPRSDRRELVALVDRFLKGGSIEARNQAQQALFGYLLQHVRAHRENPGSDLFSQVVTCKVAGQQISEFDAVSYMTLLLFGGLDTVAAMLSFIMRFLAQHPQHMAQLRDRIDDEMFVRGAIEELMRAHGVAVTTRIVTQDIVFKGVQFRENDTVLPGQFWGGLDERRFENPLEVDFNRANARAHTSFGKGNHICAGARLARSEALIFLQEWFKRIPEFSIRSGAEVRAVTGATNCLASLPLVWPVKN